MRRSPLTRFVFDLSELRRAGGALRRALSTLDGRWAVLSTMLTAGVALAITGLSIAATPPSSVRAYQLQRLQAALPYDLLTRFSGVDAIPGIAAENGGHGIHQAAILGGTPTSAALNGRLAGSADNLDGVLAAEQDETADRNTRTLTTEDGGTMTGLLTDAGVTATDAVAVVDALRPVYSPRSLQAGQVFEATFGPQDEDDTADASDAPPPRLLALSFAPTVDRQITIRLNSDGEYVASDVQKKLQTRYQHAGATINSSLYLAAMQAGIPASIVVEMIRMFSYDVDFQRDVHPNDSFEVFYTHYYTADGQPAKPGDILAATMTLDGVSRTLYRFKTPEDGVEYFNAKGQSAKNMLMKTPVDGARISSGFGMRMHPILGYSRMHKGIDFAVPRGTPVMAAGNGTVAFAGRENGYGNFVLLNHGNGYSTAYAHLSRFAPGIKKGVRVRQGQVIAYSGMTGLATGPHLHYEIRINHVQVNPLKVKVANGRKLQGRELKTFEAERAHIDQMIAALPMTTKVAVASSLRDTTEQ